MSMILVGSTVVSLPVHAAPTTLGDGDIAIIAYQSDDTDQFAFVLLKDVGSGTEINFTDRGWQSDQAFRLGNEGVLTWTADQDYPFGWVVSIIGGTSPTASTGSIAKTGGSLQLAGGGDQLFAYQGLVDSPTLLYAMQMNSNWDTEASDANKSTQPTNLSNFAVCAPERDNAVYNKTIISGTQSELLAAINDCSTNWTTSDDALTMPTGDTTEPTAVQLESMVATRDGANRVVVQWETSQEVDHAGFNLYRRAVNHRASWSMLNSGLIASRGVQGQGGVYQFVDQTATAGRWEYLLEDVETNGDRFQHLNFVVEANTNAPTAIVLAENTAQSSAATPLLITLVIAFTFFSLMSLMPQKRRITK